VALCINALDNVRGCMGYPGFGDYLQGQLAPPVLAYLQALGADTEPEPMLLSDRELAELAETFWGGPLEFDRAWVPYEPLHRRSVDCIREIKDTLAPSCAEEWARASAEFAAQLEEERTLLGSGLEVVHDWVREARRFLRAMGATHFLPYPEGTFPTPAHPGPSPSPSPPAPLPAAQDGPRDDSLTVAIAEIQNLQREVRDLLLSQRTVRDFYTTGELATLLGKAEFTVREWCRNGRVRAHKQGSGRGKHQSWVIAHEELQRLQREGLLPGGDPG
jgi:hypothetical protein